MLGRYCGLRHRLGGILSAGTGSSVLEAGESRGRRDGCGQCAWRAAWV